MHVSPTHQIPSGSVDILKTNLPKRSANIHLPQLPPTDRRRMIGDSGTTDSTFY